MLLSEAILSSSSTAVPETAVFKTALVRVGVVRVLFVSVSVAVVKETVPVKLGNVIVLSAVGSVTTNVVSCASAVAPSKTILASVNVNVVAVKFVIVGVLIVGLVKVLLVNVWEPVSVATVESTATVIVLPEPVVSIPVPPAIVNVSLSKSIAIVPLSEVISKSSAVTVESTYALIDCWVANFVLLSEAILSSSNIALPETAVFKTALVRVGVVRVLFVSVSVFVKSETVPVTFGNVIVLSAVGSVTTNVVSCASAVAPSKTIFVSNTEVPAFKAAISVFIATTASTTSVDEAIVPLALNKSAISPTSPAVEL